MTVVGVERAGGSDCAGVANGFQVVLVACVGW
jgi:hypothetical protein